MKKVAKVVLFFLWILLFLGVVYLMIYSGNTKDALVCKKYSIHVIIPDGSDTLFFISDAEVLILSCDSIVGKHYSDMDIHHIETTLRQSPYVLTTTVYGTLNGVLEVFVTQRKPLVRVINQAQEHFYLDENGCAMPPKQGISAHVPVASGNIETSFKQALDTLTTELYNLINCVVCITHDEFLKNQTGQIYIEKPNKYLLLPVIGNHAIVLGDPIHPEIRLQKLKIFYKKGISESGWAKYKTIDLRFKNQIVCLK
jgi:cell division protein FtsQ